MGKKKHDQYGPYKTLRRKVSLKYQVTITHAYPNLRIILRMTDLYQCHVGGLNCPLT